MAKAKSTKKRATAKPAAKPKRAKPKAKPKRATQPKAKKPAKQPAKLAAPDDAALLKLAIAGNVMGIFEAVEPLEEFERDEAAYKWLSVAADHGSDEADQYIDDMFETSSLRYDDDQAVTGGVHFDLGTAYLLGEGGLPRDLDKARAHFALARERYYPWSVQGSRKLIDDLARRAGADRAIVDEAFATAPAQTAAEDDGDY